MIAPLATPLASTLAAMLVLPVGLIAGDGGVPANALRDENGVPVRDENGNYILDS